MVRKGGGARRGKRHNKRTQATYREKPMGEKTKKKKGKGPTLGTLMTSYGMRIPVALTEEEEQLQLRETLQRSIVEKRAPYVPYVESASSSILEQ